MKDSKLTLKQRILSSLDMELESKAIDSMLQKRGEFSMAEMLSVMNQHQQRENCTWKLNIKISVMMMMMMISHKKRQAHEDRQGLQELCINMVNGSTLLTI